MATTIYVNSLWVDEASFNSDVQKPVDAVWGSNTFTTLNDALLAGITAGGADIKLLDSTVADDNLSQVVTKMNGASGMEFTVTGNNAGNEFIAIEMRNSGASEDFTDLAKLTITDANLNCYKLAAYQNSKVVVENSVIDFNNNQSGPLYSKGNGELYVKDSTIKANTQISAMGAVLEIDNTVLEGGSAAQISSNMIVKNNSTYTLSSAKIYGDTGCLTIEDSTMVRKAARSASDKANSFVYFVNGAANIPTALSNYSYCVFVGYSQYSTTAHSGTGIMNVDNSTFDFSAAYADKNYANIDGYENSQGLV